MRLIINLAVAGAAAVVDRDERWAMIDLRATAFAGAVVTAAILGAWLYEAANERDASVYVRPGAVAGVASVAALAWLRRRS